MLSLREWGSNEMSVSLSWVSRKERRPRGREARGASMP